jgi:hypothetical protein
MTEQSDKNDSGYEKRDVNVFTVIGTSVVLLIVLIVILFLLRDFFIAAKEEMVYEAQLKPESVGLMELRAAEDSVLTMYKIIDSKKGVYRIPVKQAMQLLAKEASENN